MDTVYRPHHRDHQDDAREGEGAPGQARLTAEPVGLPEGNSQGYPQVMSNSANDDFRDLSELLFGAKERYRSARAEILHAVDAAVAGEANRRFVDWRFAQPDGSGMGILRTAEERRAHGPDVPQDFYLDYEDTE